MIRRDRSWHDCWELFWRLVDMDRSIDRSLYIEALRLSDADATKLTTISAIMVLAVSGLVLSCMWIVWRALLWSLGQ